MRVALVAGPTSRILTVVVDDESPDGLAADWRAARERGGPEYATGTGPCCSVDGFARAVLSNVDNAALFALSDDPEVGRRAVIHVPMSTDAARTVRSLAACAGATLDMFPSSTKIDQSSKGWGVCAAGESGPREAPLVAVLSDERTHVPLGVMRVEREYAPASGHRTRVALSMRGLQPNTKHAVHVHEFGDISGGCGTAGPHWNPDGAPHGSSEDARGARHVGDLGNVTADARGEAQLDIAVGDLPLHGPRGIAGRAVVVHASADDLGRGRAADSLTTGHAGNRIACGVLGIAK